MTVQVIKAGDAGYYFADGGERDIEFEFPARTDAVRFQKVVNQLKEKDTTTAP